MAWWEVIWEWDEKDGNVAHLAEHGLTPEDVEHVLQNAVRQERSRSSQRPLLFGYAPEGRRIAVVYELIDRTTIYPITAFEVE